MSIIWRMARKQKTAELRCGWTTGACATAAAKAAFEALITGSFADQVTITLPKGEQPVFELVFKERGDDWAQAGIIKDAGDDPDVTHGALIKAKVSFNAKSDDIQFFAGKGVGTVTKPGLPVAVGEPAINPAPRKMMRAEIATLAKSYKVSGAVLLEISVDNGEELTKQTWNPRLGIEGGLSILGTTGIVHPYSCSAWIHSIHRGIDVARASNQLHVAGSTGSTSEAMVQKYYDLPDFALLDMGDFAGGMLKYLRRHPVPRVTIAGGFGKLTKLAQGHMDLHSGRSQVDFVALAEVVAALGGDAALVDKIRDANTAGQVLQDCLAQNIPVAARIATLARDHAVTVLRNDDVTLNVMVIDRQGNIAGTSD